MKKNLFVWLLKCCGEISMKIYWLNTNGVYLYFDKERAIQVYTQHFDNRIRVGLFAIYLKEKIVYGVAIARAQVYSTKKAGLRICKNGDFCPAYLIVSSRNFLLEQYNSRGYIKTIVSE